MKHQKVIKRNIYTERSKIMYRYEQLKKFNHDRRLQVYMYYFMYVDPDTITVVGHFPDTKTFVVNYKKISTLGPVPKYWLVFSYIHSE